MYGMTPSAKIDSCNIAPPEKRFTRPMKFSEALSIKEPRHCCTDLIVDAWGRNERTNTINDDDTKSEEDLVPQLLGFKAWINVLTGIPFRCARPAHRSKQTLTVEYSVRGLP